MPFGDVGPNPTLSATTNLLIINTLQIRDYERVPVLSPIRNLR